MATEKEKQSHAHERDKSTHVKESKPEARAEHADKRASADKNTSAEKSTSRAKSNRQTGEKKHEDQLAPGKSARTTDHKVIQRWVEARGGSPAAVIATETDKDPGMLRINFPGYSGADRLEDISWDDFFKKFDEKNLEFLYQDETKGGETSRFWKFVSRESKK